MVLKISTIQRSLNEDVKVPSANSQRGVLHVPWAKAPIPRHGLVQLLHWLSAGRTNCPPLRRMSRDYLLGNDTSNGCQFQPWARLSLQQLLKASQAVLGETSLHHLLWHQFANDMPNAECCIFQTRLNGVNHCLRHFGWV